jgi:Sec-independent protein translocase protein TatA
MSIGFGQILILLFFGLLLFGDLPKIIKHLSKAVQEWKNSFRETTSSDNKLESERKKKDKEL